VRRAAHAFSVIALAAALAGCGSETSAPTVVTTTGTSTGPTLTSAADVAACNELETKIRIVSRLVSASVAEMTNSLHPKQLATLAGATKKNLAFAANVLSSIETPRSLVTARKRLVAGLRWFAADFGRVRKSVARHDMARAARQLVDRPALAIVTAATRTIDRVCGA
jgi:hypothetical protein